MRSGSGVPAQECRQLRRRPGGPALREADLHSITTAIARHNRSSVMDAATMMKVLQSPPAWMISRDRVAGLIDERATQGPRTGDAREDVPRRWRAERLNPQQGRSACVRCVRALSTADSDVLVAHVVVGGQQNEPTLRILARIAAGVRLRTVPRLRGCTIRLRSRGLRSTAVVHHSRCCWPRSADALRRHQTAARAIASSSTNVTVDEQIASGPRCTGLWSEHAAVTVAAASTRDHLLRRRHAAFLQTGVTLSPIGAGPVKKRNG